MENTADITYTFLNYLQHEKRYSRHTFLSYQNDLNQFSDFLKKNYEVDSPLSGTYPMIRSWIVYQVENNYTPKSINRKIACLRSFYKFLIKKEYLAKDPMLKITALKTKKSLPVFVEETNLAMLLDQFQFADDFSGLRDKLLLELLYGTGIRLSELIGLKHSDINVAGKTIKVLGKGNKERFIPLNKSLVELINQYVAAKGSIMGNTTEYLIVTDKGEETYPVFIYRIVKKYLTLITPIEKKSPHVLRHTFATHLLNKGADLNAIKELLGHSSLAATQIYTHNSLDKIKAVFDQAHPKA